MRYRPSVLLICFIFTFSTLAAEKMPAPPIFRSAKTVAIVNDSGHAQVGDRAYDELKKWGRYQIVSNTDDADLVFVFTVNETYTTTTGPARSTTSGVIIGNQVYTTTTTYPSTTTDVDRRTYLMVFDKAGQKVWTDSHAWALRSSTRQIIKSLRDRVEK